MVFQKARELGDLIAKSDYAKVLEAAKTAYEKNAQAVTMFEKYIAKKTLYQKNIHKKLYTAKDIAQEQKELADMSKALEDQEDVIYMLNAQEEFNSYVNKVIGILKATINMDKNCGEFCMGNHCQGNGNC